MKKTYSFTQGPILPALIRFALPMLLALFLQTLYGAVDLWVVGRFAQTSDVSAVATGSQLMMTVTVVVTGLSMGITVLVGQAIGKNDPRAAGRVIGTGITLFLLLGALFTLGLTLFAAPLSGLLHAPQEAFAQTVAYVAICGGGFVFIVAYNLLGSIFRGMGDANMPLVSVAIACVFNIVGDLFFVAVLHMGAAGAAIATVLAQALSVVICLVLIRRRSLPFALQKRDFLPRREESAAIARIGTPVALQDLLVSISFLVILAIVNSMGVIASSGVGVAEKLCGFIMLVPSAFMQAMSAFVAQNVGADKPERARKSLWYGIGVSLCVGAMLGAAAFFRGDLLAGLFSADVQVIDAAAQYLRAYGIDTLLTSFLFCFIGYFNGYGKTMFVMIQGLAGAFLVRIPVAFFVSRLANATLFTIGLSTPCSSIVQILLCLGYYFYCKKAEKTHL